MPARSVSADGCGGGSAGGIRPPFAGGVFSVTILWYTGRKNAGGYHHGRNDQTQREEELARREALLAQREAQLEKEQAELAAAKAQSAERKKTLLDNNDPNFVNPKEKLYDKFPLTVHQMDIIIGVLFALILLFLVLGMTHTSFFGLFGG